MDLKFMKAEASDALELNRISKRAFDSDVEVGAASPGGPPGYQSVSFHDEMARTNHLFKLVDGNGAIMGGAILFRQGDTLNVGRIFIDPKHFRKGYGIFMMREIEAFFPDVKVITLDTPVWNIRTNAFYTGLGYVEVKRDTDCVYYSKTRRQ
jgi:GNAT superfamily N-acetyltransferase